MIVGSGAYRDGVATRSEIGAASELGDLAASCVDGGFAWVGFKDPSLEDLEQAAEVFDLHPLAIEDALVSHERPKVDVFGDTLTLVLRPARYVDETESVDMGQIAIMASPAHVIVVRHGDAVPLDDLRVRMESQPDWLAQGPGAVMHAVLDEVVEAYYPVLDGIDNDISEVEETVFSEAQASPTKRIYELKREVLEFRKAVLPLLGTMELLTRSNHPVLNPELRRYLADTGDDVKRVVDQLQTENELLTSVLDANLTQVGIRQNEDMRMMSAWIAILAVPTMVAGIYGMNFRHMPELGTRYGYFIVLGLIAVVCMMLYRKFKSIGWL